MLVQFMSCVDFTLHAGEFTYDATEDYSMTTEFLIKLPASLIGTSPGWHHRELQGRLQWNVQL